MGAVHGEELPYVLGAPLVDGFGHFPQNYTKSEVALSESIMLFLANFVKTGWVLYEISMADDLNTPILKRFVSNN